MEENFSLLFRVKEAANKMSDVIPNCKVFHINLITLSEGI